MRWTDYNDAEGRPEDKAFASEGQQEQAANHNPIHYSPGAAKDEQAPENGAIAAQDSGSGLDPNREASDGQSFSTNRAATDSPGPGTATDRGYGNVGENAYGTGVGATDLGSDSGLDERDLNSQNPDLSPTSGDLASGDFGQMSERRY